MTTTSRLEVVAIGRAAVELFGQQVGGRLEEMASFGKYVGSGAARIALAAARLGLTSAVIGRVGADPMGLYVREALAAEGVETSGLEADPERLTALELAAIRDADRIPRVDYRQNCADFALCDADLPASLIARAGALVIGGVPFSTAAGKTALMAAARQAKAGGAKVVLNIDRRPLPWGAAARGPGDGLDPATREDFGDVLADYDVIVGSDAEMRDLAGVADSRAALAALRERTRAILVVKAGREGATAWPGPIGDGGCVSHAGFALGAIDAVVADDAFLAGFLRGWLRGLDLPASLAIANAAAAIAAMRDGHAAGSATWPEIEALLARGGPAASAAEASEFEHIHWVNTRGRAVGELMVLSIDHRSQLEVIARDCDAPAARIADFKVLALRSVERAAAGRPDFGILLDGGYGARALAMAADLPLWVGRCIEKPGSRPLVFEGSSDAGMDLTTWPTRQVVKCQLRASPEDLPDLRNRQERQLIRLFDACRRTGHELMLELMPPNALATDPTRSARLMEQIYALKVRPDWWKLPASEDPRCWASVEAAIAGGDPHCRGVLVLAMGASGDALQRMFAVCAKSPAVKGFALGRTVFDDVARAWFKGAADDEATIAELASRLASLAAAWRAAGAGGPRR